MTFDARAAETLERTFTQDDFDRFAAVSGDRNPIHVDPGFCRGARFGRPVAHGMLLYAVLHALAERLLPGATLAASELQFSAPTFAEEAMRFEAVPDGEDDDHARVLLRCARVADGVVTCEGTARLRRAAA